jgi:AmmeMemoRadiSam system protein A
MLSDPQRRLMLVIARASIEAHLFGGRLDLPDGSAWPAASGVFVTLKHRGTLRGCIGTLELAGPVIDEVVVCARESATRDPRFPPLQADEWAETAIEISVLGPLELIDPAEKSAIVIGRHGLVVASSGRRGLLLPQVATEWRWTREQFLRQTCRKAGLPDDAWRTGADVFRFEADVFGE